MSRFSRIVDAAINIAKKSDFSEGKRHGAVIVLNGTIIGTGWNTRRPHGLNWTVHAEINTIRRTEKHSLRKFRCKERKGCPL